MKKSKFVLSVLGIVMLCLFFVHAAWAGEEVSVKLNGTAFVFNEAQPFVDESGRTLVPVGDIAQQFGAEKSWDEHTMTVKFNMKDTVIIFTNGSQEMTVNDTSIKMDTESKIINNLMYIPIRYFANAMNLDVAWDEASNTVLLTAKAAEHETREKSFVNDLLAQMPQDKNYIISPLSIKMAMAMAANGSDGETLQQILNVLDIKDLDEYNKACENLINSYLESSNNDVNISIANSFWLNKDYFPDFNVKFSDMFKEKMSKYYKGNAGEVTNSNGADTINGWISEHTNKKIDQVITNDDMQKLLSAIVNAVYFNGEWVSGFDIANTKTDVFTNRNGEQKNTDFMKKVSYYEYYEDEMNQVLSIPYKGYQMYMTFILPKNETTVYNVDQAIEKVNAQTESKYIDLKIPKFETVFNMKLKDTLQNMGITLAFQDNNNGIPNMYENMPLPAKIEQVFHKAFIKIDEYGTEAAAATIVGGAGTGAMPPEPIKFYANKPFAYVIQDVKKHEILFAGEYAYAGE